MSPVKRERLRFEVVRDPDELELFAQVESAVVGNLQEVLAE